MSWMGEAVPSDTVCGIFVQYEVSGVLNLSSDVHGKPGRDVGRPEGLVFPVREYEVALFRDEDSA